MPSRTNLATGIPSSKVKYSRLSSTGDGYIQFKSSPPKIPYKATAPLAAHRLPPVGGLNQQRWGGLGCSRPIIGILVLLPGFHHRRIACYACKGYRGYAFSDIQTLMTSTHPQSYGEESQYHPCPIRKLGVSLTYGGNKGGIEGIIRKTEKDAGLPHSRVPNQEQLEKQVVRLLRHWEERLRLSPPAAPRDRSLSLPPTPHSGVLRPEDQGSVVRRDREGAGDLRTASLTKPR
ncbi:hypothetical protein MC885_007710 [Smutsia gigantea]|nr:hypothetical protein MC885_007710 [Smutsia gigantea]